MLNIIIPIWNGSAVMSRSLNSLVEQINIPENTSVAVVINDIDPAKRCTSYRIALSFNSAMQQKGYTYYVLFSAPGRRTAFAAAETILPLGSVLYLDQDAALSLNTLNRLGTFLSDSKSPSFVTLKLQFARSKSALVRLFLNTMSSLPYFLASPVVAGVYAVSETGRLRWAWHMMPASVGDDKYVRLLFHPLERHVVQTESYEVVPPHSFAALLRTRIGYAATNQAIKSCGQILNNNDVSRWSGVMAFVRHPKSWPGAALLGFTLGLASCLARLK